ncbi:hypothetical protein ACFRR7_29475 [Streptomyces sp. NPDC056909]|uniref:hypothetical protein n=1 Tax=unclassified Streptomyces TaxID=2593676 RepID=UPI00343DE3A0|nr:hypothetical protein OG214_08805 [Streptomyces sp. NBC_00872]
MMALFLIGGVIGGDSGTMTILTGLDRAIHELLTLCGTSTQVVLRLVQSLKP